MLHDCVLAGKSLLERSNGRVCICTCSRVSTDDFIGFGVGV